MIYAVLVFLFLFITMTILFFCGVHKMNEQAEELERAWEEVELAKQKSADTAEKREKEIEKLEEKQEKVQSLNTGDTDTDFVSGIGILHQYAERNKK